MTLGFYPKQYYKKNSSVKSYNITFMGNPFDNLPVEDDKRTIYLQSLINYNLVVFGERFRKRLKNILVKPYGGHDIQRKVYSLSKINLGMPFSLSSLKDYKNNLYFKNRFFEIPATGNFLLTAKCQDFIDIFPEDTVGYYDDNIESLKENINRYLKDKKLREKMAEMSYKIVHEKHTYLHRFKDMFKIIKEQS